MKDFMEQQIEASERLFRAMVRDHEERVGHEAMLQSLSAGLIKKLDERDEEIHRLREQIKQLQGVHHG
jgi:tRNA(Phe) wybutosine-synthesizing methylase Tyw3